MEHHQHASTPGDPNVCAGCGGPWNAVQHQPSLWYGAPRTAPGSASERPWVLPALLAHERASGAPFRPSGGIPPQPSRIIMCPMSAVVPNTQQCPFIGSNSAETMRTHLTREHHWATSRVDDYLADPWYGDEARSAWKERTFYRRYGTGAEGIKPLAPTTAEEFAERARLLGIPPLRAVTEAQGSTAPDEEDEFCDHPNGFGPMGCPCGATRDEEDAPLTVRNLDTGEDVPATRCPECADALSNPLVRQHLAVDHGWRADRIEDFAESVNLDGSPVVPDELMRRLDLFFDPNTPTEALMSDPEKLAEALTPNALENLLTEWWMDKAEEEVRRTVPKAIEYGSTDLAQIGHDLAAMAGRKVGDEEAAELGIMFYARGKMSRWIDAVIRGDRVSDDTLFDLGVYVRMAQRVRDAGGWPGLPTKD